MLINSIRRACLETLEARQLLSFTPAVNYSGSARAIATADFNGDGKLDLATAPSHGTDKVRVRLGNGAGGFGAAQEYAVTPYPISIFTADLNNDTRPDLILSGSGYTTLIGNADGTFQPAVHTPGMELAAVQPNGNGAIGLGTWTDANWDAHVQLVFSNGQGGFTTLGGDTTYPGHPGLALVNLNNDGPIDVVTGDGTVILGVPGGLQYDWGQQSPLTTSGAVATGDFDGDTNADVIQASNDVAILRGRGDGTLHAPIHHSAYGTDHSAVATADFNADGKLDAIVTDQEKATVSVMLGNGDGTLRFAGAFATGTAPASIAVGDFNGDGRPDVAVANWRQFTFSVLLNDGNWTTLPPPPSTFSISDTTVTEGDSGTLNATFAVNLGGAAAVDVTVQYSTMEFSAFPSIDFTSTSGTLTIPAGQTSRTITVPIIGDLIPETTETFSVNLSNATGAPIADAQGIGTIIDNDPGIVISNASRAERNTGTTPFNFTVSLTHPSTQEVRVNYATASGTATASGGNRDYQSKSGTLIFPPGVTTQTVTVSVIGDTRLESDETFFVNLSQPVNAPITDNQGVATIVDDDSGAGWNWVGPASGGNWWTPSNWSAGSAPLYYSLVSISGATVNVPYSAQMRELALDGGATLKLAAGGDNTLRTSRLFLDGDAALDLGDNGLIIDYDHADESPVAAIQSMLLSGRNGGAWNGNGIFSSTAASTPGTGVSFFHASELWTSLPALFPGQIIDTSSILLRYTLLGDANADRSVNLDDFAIVASNFNQTGKTFAGGNFDYDIAGNVGLGDFALFAANFNRTLAPTPIRVLPANAMRLTPVDPDLKSLLEREDQPDALMF